MTLVDGPIWIAGGARSGLAAATLLKSRGYDVFLSDAGTLAAETRDVLQNARIPFEEGTHSTQRFLAEASALVVSPALLLSKGLPFEAKKAGIPVFGEIEVGCWFLQGHETIVGVTGTNGKSTTTAYTAQALERGGRSAVACGNIGLPFCEAVAGNYDHFALELSSYQLETTFSLQLDVGVLLNLQQDHLLRYETMAEYLKAKWRLLLLVKDTGLCVVDEPVLEQGLALGLPLPRAKVMVLCQGSKLGATRRALRTARGGGSPGTGTRPLPWAAALDRARTLPVSLYHDLRALQPSEALGTHLGYAWVERTQPHGLRATWTSASGSNSQEMTVREPVLPGFHNATNILAATVACSAVGVRAADLAAQWERHTSHYVHLPHRLEFVLRAEPIALTAPSNPAPHAHKPNENIVTKRVSIVNDSKATNVESTLVALRSFEREANGKGGVRLLVGGEPKGESFLPLVPFHNAPVVKFYPFGKAASLVAEDLSTLAGLGGLAPSSETLEEAAERAVTEAQQGDVLLLSPACASFDAFRNFEHRGDVFRAWALSKRMPEGTAKT